MGCAQSKLSDQEVQTGLRNVIRDGLTTQIMSTLTGSIFLVAFAVALGASNMVVGLIAAIPSLANVMQIPTIYLVEKIRVRRSITVLASALSRMFLVVIALIPFIFPLAMALPLVLLALVCNALLASIGGCSWNSWMHDLLPQESLGRFFSKRMLLATAVGIPLAVGAGFFVDYWKATYPGMILVAYAVLFVGGFIAGLIGVLFLSKTPEPMMHKAEAVPRLGQLLKQPFEDKNFKNLIVFLTAWNLAINIAAPFFTVFMLRGLGMDMTMVVILSAVCQLTSLGFFKVWGRLTDRLSNKSVLSVSGPLYIAAIFMWTLLTLPFGRALALPLLITINMLMGMATAGVNLACGNIGLKLAPSGKATSYLASSSLFASMAAGIAPLVGGMVAQYFTQWDIFFLVATAIGLYALHRLSLVKEAGDVDNKVVVKELALEMKNGAKQLPPVKYMTIVPKRIGKVKSLLSALMIFFHMR